MKKRWYDYMWIVELTYLVLGFFNILFAWLGMLFFCIPLIIVTTVEKQYKGHHQKKGLKEGFSSRSALARPRSFQWD